MSEHIAQLRTIVTDMPPAAEGMAPALDKVRGYAIGAIVKRV